MSLNMVEQNPGIQGGAGILIIHTKLWKILPGWGLRNLLSGLLCSLTEVDNQLGSCYSTLMCKKNNLAKKKKKKKNNLALKGGFVAAL